MTVPPMADRAAFLSKYSYKTNGFSTKNKRKESCGRCAHFGENSAWLKLVKAGARCRAGCALMLQSRIPADHIHVSRNRGACDQWRPVKSKKRGEA